MNTCLEEPSELHSQLVYGESLYTSIPPSGPRHLHLFSITAHRQHCPLRRPSVTYPNIVIASTSCQSTFPMWLEVCRVYRGVLSMPVDDYRCGLHGDGRMGALELPSMQVSAAAATEFCVRQLEIRSLVQFEDLGNRWRKEGVGSGV